LFREQNQRDFIALVNHQIRERGGNARELKGKTLTLTLVSDAGATEATWTVP
jgi:hypothetical protein